MEDDGAHLEAGGKVHGGDGADALTIQDDVLCMGKSRQLMEMNKKEKKILRSRHIIKRLYKTSKRMFSGEVSEV